jgi:hypothetical protein
MSKVAIIGNTSGTGVFTVASPNSNVDRVLTLPDESGTVITTAGVPTSAMPAGSVIQVVSATKTDVFSSSSNSWVDVTGWSASITPSSASSKILVLAGGYTSHSAANGFAYLKLLRNSADIALGNSRGSATRASMDATQQTAGAVYLWAKHSSIVFLDSPISTSSVTYKLQMLCTNSTLTFVGGTADVSDANRSNVPTTITLMEIAG